ncbi:hypothetical protein D3C76_1647750 [compost metagenome]
MTMQLNYTSSKDGTHQKSNGQQGSNMSLPNTSQPDGSQPEELVPSRYALRVGEIDVLVVSDGVLPLPTETMSTNADP